MKRFINAHKKAVAAIAAVAIVAGSGMGAYAYFTTTGSTTGTASTGVAGTWAVTNASTTGTLYPGQGSATVSAVVKNPTGNGQQGLNQLEVQITSVAEGAAGTAFDSSESANPCTNADYALVSSVAGWVVSNGSTTADTAKYAVSPAADIAPGHYVVNAADSASTGNALPAGVTLTMVDNTSGPQDRCQGAKVTLTVSAS